MNDDSGARLARRYRAAAAVLGTAVTALGVVVLVGWAAGISALTTVAPGLASMKPNTACGFALAGTALVLSTRPGFRALPWLQGGLAGVVSLLGLLTVAEYLLGVDLGIDNLVLEVPVDPAAGTAPRGRMALATAVAFSCCGLALLPLHAGKSATTLATQGLAIAGGLIGLLAVFGYLLEVKALYAVFSFSSVAIHTALGILAVAAGILLSQPERGVMGALASPHMAAPWPGRCCRTPSWRRW